MKKVLVALLMCLACGVAQADTIYSNVDLASYSGFGFANGGAVGGETLMVADDIVPIHGGTLYGATWTIFNFSATDTISFGMNIGFWDDAAYDGLDTFLGGFSIGTFTLGPSSASFVTVSNIAFLGITLPSNPFWVGANFTNFGGATGATDAQLSSLGGGLFDPPTLGFSDDVFFWSTAPGSNFGSFPVGGYFFFGGSPVANFGWQFNVVPEPATASLVGLLGCVVLGTSRRRRK